MSYKVVATENFQKEAKSLLKKYPSLKNDLAHLGALLAAEPKPERRSERLVLKSGWRLLQTSGQIRRRTGHYLLLRNS